MNYVIGSGPAGVAAAAALLDRGERVTMLDAGGELEDEARTVVERMSSQLPGEWASADVASVRGPLRYNSEGAPLKLAFGSDYPYRDVDVLQPVDTNGVDAYRALAAGGLSVLWGAAMLPFSEADLDQWPLTMAELQPHYVAALGLTGLAAGEDALARIYPLYVAPTTLALSAQAQLVHERVLRHEAELERQGIVVGRARLAVTQPTASGQSCVYCGMCLYGCPYGLIYSAQATLRSRLMPNRAFSYVGGVLVRRLVEDGRGVTIHAVSRDNHEPRTFDAARVFLAAGALGSTSILLDSLPPPAGPLVLKQSDHFLLPLWLQASPGRATGERLHTLSQLFIEVNDPAVSRHGVHLQLYTYSDFYTRMARATLGPLYPVAAPLVDRLLERLVVLKGYLHSDESAGIRVDLRRGVRGSVLRLEAVPSPRARAVVGRVAALIHRNRRRLGATPLRAGLRRGLPGSGVHVGGSFPMRARPGEFESDRLGRPRGFERVHAVDATVFPSLPAAPPTLAIMANAFRIVSEVGEGLRF